MTNDSLLVSSKSSPRYSFYIRCSFQSLHPFTLRKEVVTIDGGTEVLSTLNLL